MINFNMSEEDYYSLPLFYKMNIYIAENEIQYNGYKYRCDEETFDYIANNYEVEA